MRKESVASHDMHSGSILMLLKVAFLCIQCPPSIIRRQDGKCLRRGKLHLFGSLIAHQLMFLPGQEPAVSLLDDGQGAKAVMLDFIDPVGIRFWLLDQRHRRRNDHETNISTAVFQNGKYCI